MELKRGYNVKIFGRLIALTVLPLLKRLKEFGLMAMTEAQIQQRLNSYLEAEQRILESQEYRIGDRSLKRADLSKIREAISELTAEAEVAAQNGKGSVRRVVF